MSVKIILTAAEARVIGCLIEKQITTPDQYPLSINALTNACNQKSNRDPVLAMAETEVQQLADVLVRKHVVMERGGFGSRVPKYQHCYCNTEIPPSKTTTHQLANVLDLWLRNEQTPGEAARGAHGTLRGQRRGRARAEAGRARRRPVVWRLPRQPGWREARYVTLTGEPSAELTAETCGAGRTAAPTLPAEFRRPPATSVSRRKCGCAPSSTSSQPLMPMAGPKTPSARGRNCALAGAPRGAWCGACRVSRAGAKRVTCSC
jgi:uncharacterized protein YceH (UPF0502 family)